ncbi:MAG: helicase-exonuclease AddAB subunit AddA [Eubacterium sp.]|nr:helicase-exonuclease AddAB subunit AddA [Eubacterium sp.]
MEFTENQKKVIDTRGTNILVSAAAGSGKTAVLVQRIIKMVTEERTDIDSLLVVTFTKAAAAEMRERISDGISKVISEGSDDSFLRRQAALVHNAKICTIDSFCQSVIKNYFYRTNVEPSFRIGDESEMKLIRSDVMEEILEEKYSGDDEDFFDFVESFSGDKDDKKISELVEKLYDFSSSYPWPKEYLEICRKKYDITTVQELKESEWLNLAAEEAYLKLSACIDIEKTMLELCERSDGPAQYYDFLSGELNMLEEGLGEEGYDELKKVFFGFEFLKLPSKKNPDCDENVKKQVQELRKKVKAEINKVKTNIFTSHEEVLEQIKAVRKNVNSLIDLCLEFSERFAAEKNKRNTLDFSDLEHFALDILRNPDSSEHEPTDIAKEMRDIYKEIMVDEYQDSNNVQEAILTAISNGNNLFMVGDVKQSIYGFRMARPEIFMEKYERYADEKDGTRILLSMNFRSRKGVIDGVNDIFKKLMINKVGGITYGKNEALYKGPLYDKEEVAKEDKDKKPEIIITEKNPELEAAVVAKKINELVLSDEPMQVFDKKSETMRDIRYGDIAILVRSLSSSADVFTEALKNAGIPSFSQSSSGYFETYEVKLLIALLQITDNPRQDIPLVSVLTSVLFGFSDDMLAKIKLHADNTEFYDALEFYADDGEDENLKECVKDFLETLYDLREKSSYMQIHELIEYIFDVTDFEAVVFAMPAGRKRLANVQMLYTRAVAFEKTSYRGLFQFIRYLEQLRTFELDYGEADGSEGAGDAVEILTIHKSKGLEYPVVFVCALGKQFNDKDLKGKVVLHHELGIGCEAVDVKRRIKSSTLIKDMIRSKIKREMYAEEMRVLYVALTRAREKLYLTIGQSGAEFEQSADEEAALAPEKILGSNGFFDWILKSAGEECFDRVFVESEDEADAAAEDIVISRMARGSFESLKDTALPNLVEKIDEGFKENAEKEDEVFIPAKLSVSEIKIEAMSKTDEEAYEIFESPEKELYVPEFARDDEEKVNKGALRGTAYHRFLECLDFTKEYGEKELSGAMEDILKNGLMSDREIKLLNKKKLLAFLSGDLCNRMRKAAAAGLLRKEAPFVMGLCAREVNPEYDSDENVLVQGIIDVWFEEDGEIVLADYKTDFVEDASQLIDRYKKQMELYALALSKSFGKNVKEAVLYSFSLNEEINVAL